MDSIVDIVAAAVCLDSLGICEVVIPSLTEGSGTVRCQHGILPSLLPAVANIAAAHGLRLAMSSVKGELVTPTGAAIAAAFRTSDRLPETFSIKAVGLGAGKREYERPSFLRAMIIETEPEEERDEIYKLESNIDDATGEDLGLCAGSPDGGGSQGCEFYSALYEEKPSGISTECDLYAGAGGLHGADSVRGDYDYWRTENAYGAQDFKAQDKDADHASGRGTGEGMFSSRRRWGGSLRFYPEYDSVVRLCRDSGRTVP